MIKNMNKRKTSPMHQHKYSTSGAIVFIVTPMMIMAKAVSVNARVVENKVVYEEK